jgi:hypothetical protein
VWTDKNRAKYDRDHLRYPSDLTDLKSDEFSALLIDARGLWPIAR